MANPISSTPFKAMEDEAYHSFREWPILLVMRQKELEMHLAAVAPTSAPPSKADDAAVAKNAVNAVNMDDNGVNHQ